MYYRDVNLCISPNNATMLNIRSFSNAQVATKINVRKRYGQIHYIFFACELKSQRLSFPLSRS
ncbi:hypothetical protein Plhal304r1_c038g0113931 [Plasmopara halstedii]